ncbi:uncharacterized protein WCC33_013285 [Rhinophrynus dorsalis]
MASADLREELNCSICLSVYTDPVTLRCGHNFCKDCIRRVLDTQEGSGVYSCPECREEFQERPALQRNMKLCNIVERFLSTHPDQELTVIVCTYCVHSPVPAVKTCLHCETSLCDTHLSAHNKSVEHVLTDPTTLSSKRKCSIHNELLKYYCSEDTVCICVSCCLVGKHRGHEVELLNEASEKRKETLRDMVEKLTLKREETEERIQSLENRRREIQGKSTDITQRVSALIRDIREQLEALEKRVLSEISRQEEQVSLQVSGLIQQLEINKDELSRKIRHIEELCNKTDPLSVLQGIESDSEVCDAAEGNDKEIDDAVCDLDEGLMSVTLHAGLADIVVDAKKKFYVQEATDVLLDINTAHKDLSIFGDLKTAARSKINQNCPQTSERFTKYFQVLSTRSFSSGRHYWEVETSESGSWKVGVAYPSIEREGDQSCIGRNERSWCIHLHNKAYSVKYYSKMTPLKPKTSLQRLGVYLDYEAGRLSFYQLCDPIRHLHTFTATFTEPLHPAFHLYDNEFFSVISLLLFSRMASADLREELNCSVCLSIYTDPVMLGCGHNFCRVCIGSVLDSQEKSGVYSCPECRAEFQERPALQRNMKLCNIVEHFRNTHTAQEVTGIFCTYCVHSPIPAVKTCLQCEISLCDIHLKIHNKSVEHVLIEPTASLKNRKCSIHKEFLNYYCSDDSVCICASCCLAAEHRGHQVGLLNEAFENMKTKLRDVLNKLTTKRKETEERVQRLQGKRKKVHEKSADVTEQVIALFMHIREQLEALEKRVLSEISRQLQKVTLPISDQIKQLEIEKDDLSRKMCHIVELCKRTDPFTVLHEWESHRVDVSDVEGGDRKDHVAVGELDEGLISVTLHRGLADLMTDVKRGFYVHDAIDLSLDINTAGNNVVVSGDMKTVSWSEAIMNRPRNNERFDSCQVLSTRSFSSGRHYWEVETSESGIWRVGVAYPSIGRDGDQFSIGDDKGSWCLYMFDKDYSVIHNSKETVLNPETSLKKLGIFLDYKGGRLSFYQLCDPVTHLHTFTATFTEPLHAAFRVYMDGWVKIRS